MKTQEVLWALSNTQKKEKRKKKKEKEGQVVVKYGTFLFYAVLGLNKSVIKKVLINIRKAIS